jgi:hypothetical protein
MTPLRVTVVPLVLLLLALPASAQAPQAQKSGSIIGVVRTAERGPVLEGARVTLLGTALAAVTNGKGEFTFHGLAPGKYTIQASAIGFATLSSEVEVKPRETLEVEFQTESEGVRLPELAVSEKPNLPPEFVRRSQEGGGRYMDRAAIERRNANSLGDLLRTVPGLRVSCASYPCRIQLTRQMRSACPLAYWLDGTPTEAGTVLLQPPRDLDGVEIYSGLAETPPELYQPNTCGALAVWTRVPPKAIKRDKKPKPAKPDTTGNW